MESPYYNVWHVVNTKQMVFMNEFSSCLFGNNDNEVFSTSLSQGCAN